MIGAVPKLLDIVDVVHLHRSLLDPGMSAEVVGNRLVERGNQQFKKKKFFFLQVEL